MEKLIKLINKRQDEKHPDGVYLSVVTYKDGIFYSDGDCLSPVIDEIHLISNSCGFIKWLIEKGFAYWKAVGLLEDMYIDEYSDRKSSIVDATIMRLSIEDEPIDFLIGILR